MRSTITITDNILHEVLQEIRETASKTLAGAGDVFREVAQDECPVSNIDEPGYVHLVETIGYEVDTQSTAFQQWVTFFAQKSYAQFVNDGTSRMAPRPFFSDGVLAVGDRFESVVEKEFSNLMLGRAEGKK